MTQKELIMDHMRQHGSITSAEAMYQYGIGRLASRIWDLRNDGYDIQSQKVTQKNRYGKKVSFDRYTLHDTGRV